MASVISNEKIESEASIAPPSTERPGIESGSKAAVDDPKDSSDPKVVPTDDAAEISPDLRSPTPSFDTHNAPKRPSRYDSWLRRALTPKRCRLDGVPPKPLSLSLCLLYALASTFTVANLYYVQPIFTKLAHDFNVTYERSSNIATLLQAGYAGGILLILPLGDILERRPLVIGLIAVTATLWIGLCITQSFVAFETISFICGVTTVTPQLMIPLIGDFAPNHRKQVWISIVVSGLLLGMLVARVLSGVVANYTSWRNIYWISCAAQYVLVALLFVFMPDYPSTNPEGLSYLKALWSIVYMMFTEPVLVQACLIVFCFSCVFTSFWTTLTFLLAEPPYEYSTVDIGLFALIGLIALVTIPLYARLMDRYVPMLSILCGQFILLSGVTISTAISTFTVAGPIIHAIAVDVGIQIGQVSNRAVIFNINPKARNRVNTAYMVLAFAGQLTGTAVGNKLFAEGGWRWSSGCSIGFVVLSIIFALCRGPRETGWIGWAGGVSMLKDVQPPNPEANSEAGLTENENMADNPKESK